MLFNSIQFLIFFAVVTALFFGLPHRFRWAMLLAASCWFYMAFIPVYLLILVFTIVIDYFAGIAIAGASGTRRRWFLVASIVANVGVLAFFKYYNFLNDNLAHALGLAGVSNPVPFLRIILPIGLSFHTFQAMSYTIEVYRGHHPAERHFGIYALYVMFYPQLVAGPIERPGNLLHQFHARHDFDPARVSDGLKLILWGLFQKVVVADRLAPFVNQVYDRPTQYEGLPLALATFFFAFQIYADFAGYSDIAIGAAQVMGFQLMTNFRRPYFARSIAEFWKRWHISLSTWFRDYLYISLGGNRVAKGRWLLNLMITFVVSGLWHGAKWTFVVWGGLNGLYLVSEIWAHDLWSRFRMGSWPAWLRHSSAALRMPLTFALACLAWVFFRANSTSDALHIVGHLFSGLGGSLSRLHDREFLKANVLLDQGPSEFLCALAVIAGLLAVQVYQERVHQQGGRVRDRLAARPVALRWAVYYVLIAAILFLGAFNRSRQFIYFQF
ncbi:MAG: MBOAT family protein [Candidatus Eisenbacteria bacterium]|nr:MBOAT family protein [Candidatus Eisenbacteria bacterium]